MIITGRSVTAFSVSTIAVISIVAGSIDLGFQLLAQTTPDPITGGAGWVGAGLLGLVLGWLLLKHLPDKDKQLEKLLTDKDERIAKLMQLKDEQIKEVITSGSEYLKMVVTSHASSMQSLQETNHKSLQAVILHCDEEAKRTTEVLSRDFTQLAGSIEELSSLLRMQIKPQKRGQPPDS